MENQRFTRRQEDDEIDLLPIFRALKKHAVLIIIFTIAFGVLGYAGTKIFVTPTYRTGFSVYVNNSLNDERTQLTSSDISASRALSDTYAEIIGSRTILAAAADAIGLKYETASSLQNIVTVKASDTTEVIYGYVEMEDPAAALLYAQSIIRVVSEQLPQIVDGSAMRLVDDPYLPTSIYSPSYSRNAVVAALAGFVLAAGFVALRVILDNRVHSEDDLEERFGIAVLGSIPSFETAARVDGKGKYGYSGYAGTGRSFGRLPKKEDVKNG